MNSSALRTLVPAAAAGLIVVVSACGAGSPHASATARQARQANAAALSSIHVTAAAQSGRPATAPPASLSAYTGLHFNTPQAAMRYLAHAYNHHDRAQLHAVTTPTAFRQLMAMRSEAVNLRLLSCVPSGSGRGDYVCTFRHDYPASLHRSGHGSSRFLVAPALNPGWYMYKLLDCG